MGTDDDNVKRFLTALEQDGVAGVGAFDYMKSVCIFSKSMPTSSGAPLASSNSIGAAYALSVLDTLSKVTQNVNKLILSNEKASMLSRDVAAIMGGKAEGEIVERYGLLHNM